MIGNDVVDLKQAAKESDWKRPRFLDKVFTSNEQQLIFTSENKNETVWLLWSMKEAGYKMYVQQFGKRFFNPKKLKCTLISLEKGTVIIENEIYFTSSTITENYIYTVATLNEETIYKSDCFSIEKSSYELQTATVKKAFLASISLETDFLKIKKNRVGVPKLYYKNGAMKPSFSLTHHGFYGAYAALL